MQHIPDPKALKKEPPDLNYDFLWLLPHKFTSKKHQRDLAKWHMWRHASRQDVMASVNMTLYVTSPFPGCVHARLMFFLVSNLPVVSKVI